MSRFERGSGILLHPTALPGPYGIGTLGAPACQFLDFLHKAKQKYWQICPLGPTGYGDSPYQGFSAFAGNPNLIDLKNLQEEGLLEPENLSPLQELPTHRVDFALLIPRKENILRQAWKRFQSPGEFSDLHRDLDNFRQESSHWLEDYTLFRALKDHHGGSSWENWTPELRFRDPNTLKSLRQEKTNEIGFHEFVQFLFARQWKALRKIAKEKNIKVIGDLPIFVSYDSADCWSKPELFLLDEKRHPTQIAGVPPDYFSSTGQLWGNPLYNWKRMEEDQFSWWIEALRIQLKRHDILRIDHFRGFTATWAVPAGETTAINGLWLPSHGNTLFRTVREVLGEVPIIAEDLGYITDDVRNLMAECGFPGMKILQFAFDSTEENNYLPHTYKPNTVVYTGTHDNDTSIGWFASASERDKKFCREYLNYYGNDISWALIRAAMSSVADLAIFPLQDLLRLGSAARFNTPGTQGGNWTWRADGKFLDSDVAENLASLVGKYGRT